MRGAKGRLRKGSDKSPSTHAPLVGRQLYSLREGGVCIPEGRGPGIRHIIVMLFFTLARRAWIRAMIRLFATGLAIHRVSILELTRLMWTIGANNPPAKLIPLQLSTAARYYSSLQRVRWGSGVRLARLERGGVL